MRSVGGAQSLELFGAGLELGRDAMRLRCNAAARPPILRFWGMLEGCAGVAIALRELASFATAAAARIRG